MEHSEHLSLKTPQGNELFARITNGQVAEVKAIDCVTGRVFRLGDKCAENLRFALQAETMHTHIGHEVQNIRHTIDRFPELIKAMGKKSAALKPYLDNLQVVEKTRYEMANQAGHFKNTALRYADIAVARHEANQHARTDDC